MTKFDSILTDLCEANNYPAPGTQQNNQTTAQQPAAGNTAQQPVKPVTGSTTAQTQQPAPTNTNTASQPQKPTPVQIKNLMDDFNNTNVKVNNVADFKKYGINL
jgi:hypothetical protein